MMGRSMTTPSFFEGPEKKLEAVVTPGFPPLRSLGDDAWHGIVESARAKVLSVLRTEHCDAYLLSESSLFVFDDWFVLITCGQTTLVDAVPPDSAFDSKRIDRLPGVRAQERALPGAPIDDFLRRCSSSPNDAPRAHALFR